MRICLVSQEYPPETAHGGIATQTHAKARGLASRGHEVHVISASVGTGRSETADGTIRVVRIPGFDEHLAIHTEIARAVTWSAQVAAEIASLHARTPLDLVDFPDYGAEAFVHLLNRAEWNRVATTVHVQGPTVMLARTLGWPDPASEEFRVAAAMEGACLRLADAVYAAGACSADWAAREHGLDRARIPVLHTGVDTRRFAPGAAERDGRPTVVCVGKVARTKGADLLARAAVRVASELPAFTVRFVGRVHEPRLVDEMRHAAEAAGFPRLLEFAGPVTHDDLPRELCRARAMAAPSLYEGGPSFVCLEAMACGLPVIACEGSGASDVVRDGESGLLVPPGDEDALVRALRTVLADTALCDAMGERARRFAVTEADSETCLDAIERLLVATASRARGPAS